MSATPSSLQWALKASTPSMCSMVRRATSDRMAAISPAVWARGPLSSQDVPSNALRSAGDARMRAAAAAAMSRASSHETRADPVGR